ncbi:MAG: hypothetical protein Q8936_06690 [Bacillota bacterium]|nr:hypothetical protein [Bacillota bacterium]
MSTTFNVEGLPEIFKRLEGMGRKGVSIENNSLINATNPILEDAKNTTAFKDVTGKLRKSLKTSNVKKNKGIKFVWVGDVDKQANYSWYVEYGDSKTPPKPFLRPAYEKNKGKVLENIRNEIKKALK